MAGSLTISTLNDSSGVLATQNGMTGIAKAWVYFAGASGSINASFNVSSVTRNATGDYNINFTTSLPSANYAPVCITRNGSIAGLAQGSLTTSTFRFLCSNTSGTSTDSTDNGVAVFSS